MSEIKSYVLDTSVLIHDPYAIFRFKEHKVLIPYTVLCELDGLKSKGSSVAAEARQAIKNIKQELDSDNPLLEVVHYESNCPVNDDKILSVVKKGDTLVTRDINMYVKAKASHKWVEEYKNDSLEDEVKTSVCILDENNNEVDPQSKYYYYEGDMNIYRTDSDKRLPFPSFFGVKPRNTDQLAFMAALKDDNTCVIAEAPAGSGKTFLALAYALETTFEKRKFKRVIIMRSGDHESIGYLPGTEEEKMLPWLQGFIDNMEALFETGHMNRNEEQTTIKHVIEKAGIKFRAMDLVRGRSYQDTLIIVDEAQNNTRHQLKSILTRVGEGSKIIVLGNLSQIDTKYLTRRSSGLMHACNVMVGYDKAAVIPLRIVERSELTEFVEINM